MIDDLILYDYIYNKNEITVLQNLCKEQNWKRVNDYQEDDVNCEKNINGNRYIKNVVGYIKYFPPEKIVDAYLNHLPELEAITLREGFIESKGYTPDSKISKYNANDSYDWHCDCWIKSKENISWSRQISSVTYLNDNYEGGETEFSSGLVIKPKTGKTVVFPSNWCFPHKGKPVIRGTKYIYVMHIWV